MRRRALLAAAFALGAATPFTAPALARATARGQPLWHDNARDGRAMAPDGSHYVLPVAYEPSRELLLLPIGAFGGIGGQRLLAANANLTLLHPAFTPDGGGLVMVASLLTPDRQLSAGELWRVDLASGSTQLIGEPWQAYAWPSVSPDGKRLAYWKGLGASGEAVNFDYRAPIPHWALYERGLAGGGERRLHPDAFEHPGPLFHDPKGRGLFAQLGPSPNAPRTIALIGPQPAPVRSFLADEAFPIGVVELAGVTADGRAFLVWSRPDGDRPRFSGCFTDGGPLTEAFTPGPYGAQNMLCSADGKTFVGVRDDLDDPARRHQTLYEQRPGETLTVLRLNAVHGTHSPLTLAPAGSRLR